MSAIFGETLTFGQRSGPDVRLLVFGDEFYARYETRGRLHRRLRRWTSGSSATPCWSNGAFVSSGAPISRAGRPPDVPRHLQEAPGCAAASFAARRASDAPAHGRRQRAPSGVAPSARSAGLLRGRQLSSGTVRGLTDPGRVSRIWQPRVTPADVDRRCSTTRTTRATATSARCASTSASSPSGKLDYSNDVVGPFRLQPEPRLLHRTPAGARRRSIWPSRSGVDLAPLRLAQRRASSTR